MKNIGKAVLFFAVFLLFCNIVYATFQDFKSYSFNVGAQQFAGVFKQELAKEDPEAARFFGSMFPLLTGNVYGAAVGVVQDAAIEDCGTDKKCTEQIGGVFQGLNFVRDPSGTAVGVAKQRVMQELKLSEEEVQMLQMAETGYGALKAINKPDADGKYGEIAVKDKQLVMKGNDGKLVAKVPADGGKLMTEADTESGSKQLKFQADKPGQCCTFGDSGSEQSAVTGRAVKDVSKVSTSGEAESSRGLNANSHAGSSEGIELCSLSKDTNFVKIINEKESKITFKCENECRGVNIAGEKFAGLKNGVFESITIEGDRRKTIAEGITKIEGIVKEGETKIPAFNIGGKKFSLNSGDKFTYTMDEKSGEETLVIEPKEEGGVEEKQEKPGEKIVGVDGRKEIKESSSCVKLDGNDACGKIKAIFGSDGKLVKVEVDGDDASFEVGNVKLFGGESGSVDVLFGAVECEGSNCVKARSGDVDFIINGENFVLMDDSGFSAGFKKGELVGRSVTLPDDMKKLGDFDIRWGKDGNEYSLFSENEELVGRKLANGEYKEIGRITKNFGVDSKAIAALRKRESKPSTEPLYADERGLEISRREASANFEEFLNSREIKEAFNNNLPMFLSYLSSDSLAVVGKDAYAHKDESVATKGVYDLVTGIRAIYEADERGLPLGFYDYLTKEINYVDSGEEHENLKPMLISLREMRERHNELEPYGQVMFARYYGDVVSSILDSELAIAEGEGKLSVGGVLLEPSKSIHTYLQNKFPESFGRLPPERRIELLRQREDLMNAISKHDGKAPIDLFGKLAVVETELKGSGSGGVTKSEFINGVKEKLSVYDDDLQDIDSVLFEGKFDQKRVDKLISDVRLLDEEIVEDFVNPPFLQEAAYFLSDLIGPDPVKAIGLPFGIVRGIRKTGSGAGIVAKVADFIKVSRLGKFFGFGVKAEGIAYVEKVVAGAKKAGGRESTAADVLDRIRVSEKAGGSAVSGMLDSDIYDIVDLGVPLDVLYAHARSSGLDSNTAARIVESDMRGMTEEKITERLAEMESNYVGSLAAGKKAAIMPSPQKVEDLAERLYLYERVGGAVGLSEPVSRRSLILEVFEKRYGDNEEAMKALSAMSDADLEARASSSLGEAVLENIASLAPKQTTTFQLSSAESKKIMDGVVGPGRIGDEINFDLLRRKSNFVGEGQEGMVLDIPQELRQDFGAVADKELVLKVMKEELPVGHGFMALPQQAAVLNQLAEKGFAIRIYGVSDEYYIAEKIYGTDMSKLSIGKKASLKPKLIKLGNALAESGLKIHDLGGQNLFVTASGDLKIIDIGSGTLYKPTQAKIAELKRFYSREIDAITTGVYTLPEGLASQLGG